MSSLLPKINKPVTFCRVRLEESSMLCIILIIRRHNYVIHTHDRVGYVLNNFYVLMYDKFDAIFSIFA